MTAIISIAVALTALLTAACEDREPQNVAFDMELLGGELSGDSLLSVNQDDTVTLNWTSDVPVLVHLHGYDIELAVAPGATEPMRFTADATGRFNITIHSADSVHVHGSGEACRVSVPEGEPQPAISIAAAESRMEGNVFIEVDVENFEIEPGGGHWHLTMDGVDYGMYSRADVTLAVDGTGQRVFEATLADANHCLYDASDSATVLIAGEVPMPNDTTMSNDDMDMGSMDHDNMAMAETPNSDDSMPMDGTPMGHDMSNMNGGSGDHNMDGMSGSDSPSAAGIPETVIATLEVRP